LKAKEMVIERLQSNKDMYKSPTKGDLVSRIFDTATGIYLYSYRDYDHSVTVAIWPEGQKAITASKVQIWCEVDKKWKHIKL
jgi:hypothetical protein